ncbi:hypothetical protein, partial [Klebsiella pneumoniae]|uniref:hypothetical protein n=1 Tax=Klebsiella pneumoniae TaxID=573 RepID=UPI002247D3A9
MKPNPVPKPVRIEMRLPHVTHTNGFHFFRVLSTPVWQVDIDTTIIGRIRIFIDQSIVVIHYT